MISTYDNAWATDPRDSEPECPQCGGGPGDYEDGYCCEDCMEEYRKSDPHLNGPDPDDARDRQLDEWAEGDSE